MNNALNLIIDEPLWLTALQDVAETAQVVFDKTLAFAATEGKPSFLNLKKPLNINLSLGNDTEVHRLNRDFRNMDKPTNVLSFAAVDDDDFENMLKQDDVIELGDIIIALETMQREADETGISLHNHFCHLLTHGILHLLGFDHQTDEEAEEMESREIAILRQLNINNPYEE